ncbi:limonene-1,2-epoxide hydrolase family protein [Actinocorallia populi]|uniref:limonene-1,2-epoxide hydrolase family protein n=1 Tax=Actinocorallia populi TaxID=2079200 RepID=UPI000D08A955|nr:limonene-1,2-epoxide hydrolase family protein [Actinocorallia populi]
MADENVKVVRDFLAALEDLDLAAAGEFLAPGVLYQNVPLPPARGKAATLRTLKLMLRYGTGFEARIHEVSADGDTVLTVRTDALERGRWRAEFWVCGTFRVRDGKIVLWRDYFDWTTLLWAGLRGLGGLLRSRPAGGTVRA